MKLECRCEMAVEDLLDRNIKALRASYPDWLDGRIYGRAVIETMKRNIVQVNGPTVIECTRVLYADEPLSEQSYTPMENL